MVAPTRSTAVAKAKLNLPANVDAMFAQDVVDLRGRLAQQTGDRIRIDNKQFKLPGGAVLDFLEVVIVDFVYANRYYEQAWEKGVVIPPVCFSTSPNPEGMVPSPVSPEVQSKTDCKTCVMNQFGSAGKAKACKNRVLMAILPTDAKLDTPFLVLDISPTAVAGFTSYTHSVTRALGRPPYGVVTRIECDGKKKEDVAVFSDPVKLEDPEFIMMIRGRLEEARTRLMVDPDTSSIAAANDAPPPSKLAGARKPAARRAAG